MKNIAYITGSRAEYGIVKRLLQKLAQDPTVNSLWLLLRCIWIRNMAIR